MGRSLHEVVDYFSIYDIYTEWGKRLVLKLSITGLNSAFSFSYTGCHTKIKDSVGLTIYPSEEENRLIHTFPKGICVM